MKTITAFVVRAIGFCIHYPRSGHRGGDHRYHRVVVVCGNAFLRDHRYQPAALRPTARDGSGNWRSKKPSRNSTPSLRSSTRRRPELAQEATAALVAQLAPEKNFFNSIDRAAGRRFFCAERPAVPERRTARAADEFAYAGAAAHSGAGRRSELARRGSRLAVRAAGRAVRQNHSRQHDLAADARGQHARPGEREQAGKLFLAGAGAGTRAKILRADPLR